MRNPLRTPVLIALLVLAASSVPARLAAQDQPGEEKIQRSFPVSTGAQLRVENYKGTIHVTAADTNQVTVNAVKRFTGSEADRKWWMENTKVDFENSASRVEINVHYPTQYWNCWWSCGFEHNFVAEVDLEIQVPRRIDVDLHGYKPDIKVFAVHGSVRIKSYKSPMTVESTNGSIYIDTYKDTIRLKNVAVHGGLEVKSYKADAEIEARTLDGASRLENYKGSIVLRVPGDIGLDLDFSGERRGSFRTDLPLVVRTTGRSGVRGTINQGGTALVLRTGKGSVLVEKLVGDL
ncbi:MAG TPA: hypothetical protein VKW06_12035 [Candidatus Angelobacter sp.]|nr:hypothetical protein [Candidatus Angelobacter sp.]